MTIAGAVRLPRLARSNFVVILHWPADARHERPRGGRRSARGETLRACGEARTTTLWCPHRRHRTGAAPVCTAPARSTTTADTTSSDRVARSARQRRQSPLAVAAGASGQIATGPRRSSTMAPVRSQIGVPHAVVADVNTVAHLAGGLDTPLHLVREDGRVTDRARFALPSPEPANTFVGTLSGQHPRIDRGAGDVAKAGHGLNPLRRVPAAQREHAAP